MTSPLTGANVPTDDINKKVDAPKKEVTATPTEELDTFFDSYTTAVKKYSPVGHNLGIPKSALGGIDRELIEDEGLQFSMGAGDIASGSDLIQKDLSEKQGVLGELANAIPQTAVKTFSGALSALGVGWEAIKSISPDHEFGFKDNGLMQAAANIDKSIQEMFPLYRDPTDDSLFTSENIIEGITNLPGIATGAGLTSTGIRMLNRGIFYSASKALKAGLKNEVKQTAFQAFKSAIRSSPTSKVAYGTEWLTNTVYQGASEGYMEAVQLYTDTVDKLNEEATRDLIAGKINKDQYLRKLQENEDRANNGAMVTFALGSALSTVMNLHWTKPGSGLFSGKLLKTAEDTYNANKKNWYKDLGIETGLESTEELLMAGITGGSEGLTSASMLGAPFSEQLGTFVKHGLQNMASEEGAFSAFMGSFGGAMQKVVMDGFSKYAFGESTSKYNTRLRAEIDSIFRNNEEFKTLTGILADKIATKDDIASNDKDINSLVSNSVGNHTESYLLNSIKNAKNKYQQQANDVSNPEAREQANQQLEAIKKVEDKLNQAIKLRDGNYALSNKIREINPSMMKSYINDLLEVASSKAEVEGLNQVLKDYSTIINGKEQEGKKGKKSKVSKAKYNYLPKVYDENTQYELKEQLKGLASFVGINGQSTPEMQQEHMDNVEDMINQDIYINARNKALGENTEFTAFANLDKTTGVDHTETKEKYKELLDEAERQIEASTDTTFEDIIKAEKRKEDLEKSIEENNKKIGTIYTSKNLNDIKEEQEEAKIDELAKDILKVTEEESNTAPTSLVEAPPVEPPTVSTTSTTTTKKPFTTEAAESPEVEVPASTIELESLEGFTEESVVNDLIEEEYKETKKAVEGTTKETHLTSNITGLIEDNDVFTTEGTFQDLIEHQETVFSRRLSSSSDTKEEVLTYRAYDGDGPLQISEDKQTEIIADPEVRKRFKDSIAIYTEDGRLIGFVTKDTEMYRQLQENEEFKNKGSVTFKSIVYSGTTKPRFKKSGSPIKDLSDTVKAAFRRLFNSEAKPFVVKQGPDGMYLKAVGPNDTKIGKIDFNKALEQLSKYLGVTVLFTKSGAIALSTRILDSTTISRLFSSFGGNFSGGIEAQVKDFLTAFTNIPAHSTEAMRTITVDFYADKQQLAVDILDDKTGKNIRVTVSSNGEFTEALLQSIIKELQNEDKLGDKLRTGLSYETIRSKKIDTLDAIMEVFNTNLEFIETSDGKNSIYYKVGNEMYVQITEESFKAPVLTKENEESVPTEAKEWDEDVAFSAAYSPVSEKVVVDVKYEEIDNEELKTDINKKEFHDSIIQHIAFFVHKLGFTADKIASLLEVEGAEAFLKKLNVQMTNPKHLEFLEYWLRQQQENPDNFVKTIQFEANKLTSFYTKVAKSEDSDDEDSDVAEDAYGEEEDILNSFGAEDSDLENTTDEVKRNKDGKNTFHKDMDMDVQQILSAVPMVNKAKTFIRNAFGAVQLLPPIKLIENVIAALNLSGVPINSYIDFSTLIQTFKTSDNPYLNSFYYLWTALDNKSITDPRVQMIQTRLYNHMRKSSTTLITVTNNTETQSVNTRTYGVEEKGTDFFSRFVISLIALMKNKFKRKIVIEKVKAAYNANIKTLRGLNAYKDSPTLEADSEFKKQFKASIINFFKDVYGMDLDRKGIDVWLNSHEGKHQDITKEFRLAISDNKFSISNLESLDKDDSLKYEDRNVYKDQGQAASKFAASISLLAGKMVSTPFRRIGSSSYYLFNDPRLINELITDEDNWNKKTLAETVGLDETSITAIEKIRKFKIQKLWGSIRRTNRKSKNSETSTYTPKEEFISAMTMLFGLYASSENPPLFTTPVISDTGDILVFGGHLFLKEDKTDTFNTLYKILTEYAYREYLTMAEMAVKKDSALEGYNSIVSLFFPFLDELFVDEDFKNDVNTRKDKIEKAIRDKFSSKDGKSARFESWFDFLKKNNLIGPTADGKGFGFTPLIKNLNAFNTSTGVYSHLNTITGNVFTAFYKDENEFKKDLEASQFMEYYELVYLANHMHFYEKIGMPHTMAKIDKKTKKTSAQATLDNMIKRAKAWVSSHNSANWLSKDFKTIVIEDEELKFQKVVGDNGSVTMVRVTEEGAPFDIKVNTTDAQEYSTPLEFLESLIAYGHITEKDAFGMSYERLLQVLEDLRNSGQLIGDDSQLFNNLGFINEENIEAFQEQFGKDFENFKQSKFYKLHGKNPTEADVLAVPEKNVYCGYDVDFDLSVGGKGLPGKRLVYIKSSTLPLIPANLMGKGEDGNPAGTNKNNLLAFMLRHNINRAAQESAAKVGTRKGQIIKMDELDKLDSMEVNKKTFTLNRKYYGRQQITQAKPKSKITMGTQLMYLLFEGDVTNSENAGLNQLRDQFILALNGLLATKQTKFLKEFGLKYEKGVLTIADTKVFNKQLAKSLDNYNDKLTTDLRTNFKLGEDLEFSIPIDLVGNTEKLQESLASLVTKNLVRIKLTGTSCIQVSSNGFKMLESDGLKAPSYNAGTKSIEPGEALITWPYGEEAWEEYQRGGDFTKKVNEASRGIGFRIPTSGLPSSTYLDIKWLPPNEGPIAVVSPVVVHMLGADFDVDKLNIYVRPLWELHKNPKNELALAEDRLFSIQEATFTGIGPVPMVKVDIPASRFNTMMNPIGTPTISAKIERMKSQGIDSYYDKDNPFGLLNIMNRRKVASESKILTGVFSVWVVALNKLQFYAKQTKGNLYSFTGLNSELPIVDGNKSNDSFPFIGEALKSASAFMSELQNYALDLAKDPNSDIPNINIYTSGVAGLLVSLGYDMEFVINFIANPIIKEFVRRKALRGDTMTTSGSSAYSTSDFLEELRKENITKAMPLDNSKAPNVNSTALAATVSIKDFTAAMKAEGMDIAHLLKAFDIYETAARKLIGEVKYTRQNSVGVPKNLYELIVWNRNYAKSVFAKLANEGGLLDSFPKYQEAFSLLEKMYFGRSFYKEPFFDKLIEGLSASGINLIDNMTTIRSFMLRTIVKTKGMEHLLGPGDLTKNPSIARFTEFLAIAKERYPDNRFIQSITVGFDTEEYLYGGEKKALPKIEFILKDGDEDYQKSDIADALMKDFIVLLNDPTKLIEDDPDNVSVRDFMQAYIRYNYQVYATSFRKGSILGLIPTDYITKNGSVQTSYEESLAFIDSIGGNALLEDFAKQNEDLIVKVDIKSENIIDKINGISLGGVVKDSTGTLYRVVSDTSSGYLVDKVTQDANFSLNNTDVAVELNKLASLASFDSDNDKSLFDIISNLITTVLLNNKVSFKENYSTEGNKFASYNKSTKTITLYKGKINEVFKPSGQEAVASILLFTTIEELLHSKYKASDMDVKQFINDEIPAQANEILKSYGISDINTELNASQKEELVMLITRAALGDPLLQGFIQEGLDISSLVKEHFDINIKNLVVKDFLDIPGSEDLNISSTDEESIDPNNKPCK